MLSSWSTRPAGTCRHASSYRPTSPSSRCHPNVPSSTRLRTCGSSCATTGSRTGSSNHTPISSTIVARPGTSSSISLGASCPSDCANGPTSSDQWDSVLARSGDELSELCSEVPPARNVDVVSLHHRARKRLWRECFLDLLWSPLFATPHLLDANHRLHERLLKPLMHHFFDRALEVGPDPGILLPAEPRDHILEDAEVRVHQQRILVMDELRSFVLHPVVFRSSVFDADPLDHWERIDGRFFAGSAALLLKQMVDVSDLAVPFALRPRAALVAGTATSFRLRARERRAADADR